MKNNAETSYMAEILDNATGRSGSFKKWCMAGFILFLVIGSVFFLRTKTGSVDIHYLTKAAYRGDMTVKVSATGNLVPTNEVEVGSELSGIIRTVEVDYNDRVKAGQVMARLDDSRLRAEVLKSKASLFSAKAKLLSAKANLWKIRRKFLRFQSAWEKSNHKIPSQDQMDSAKAAFESAKADVEGAKAGIMEADATLKAYMTQLSKTVIYSPINGIVLRRNVEPGQTVAASFQSPVLFTLAEDLTGMELHVDVDEADVGRVRAGQDAVFTVDAYPDRSFSGKVLKVHYGSKTTAGVVTYEAVIGVKNSDRTLLPGMTASCDITTEKFTNVLLIYNSVLRFSPPKLKNRSSGTGFIKKIIPHRHFRRKLTRPGNKEYNTKKRRVWTVVHNELVPVDVIIGETNGEVTEVSEGNIKPGMKLVTGISTNSD